MKIRPAALACAIAAAGAGAVSCARTSAPDIDGRWSGEMMLELAKGNPAFVKVEAVLVQRGKDIRGRWRTLDSERHVASGELTGSLTRTEAEQHVDVSFTFVGHYAGSTATAGLQCRGTARASGQLTRNTITGIGGSREEPPWSIRLKAFDGFGFESCPPIRYATWTLTRP